MWEPFNFLFQRVATDSKMSAELKYFQHLQRTFASIFRRNNLFRIVKICHTRTCMFRSRNSFSAYVELFYNKLRVKRERKNLRNV